MLKSEVKEVVDTTELLEDRIERERRALTTRTPVTLERLQLWLKNKQERKAEQEAQVMEEAKESYKKGKRPVISGRALFAIDPSLFIDDDAAGEGALEREESDDDEDEGERKAVDFTPLSGPELTRTPRGLCRVRTRHACQPPALGTCRRRRAARPQGARTVRTGCAYQPRTQGTYSVPWHPRCRLCTVRYLTPQVGPFRRGARRDDGGGAGRAGRGGGARGQGEGGGQG